MGPLARSLCLLPLLTACADDPPFQSLETLCDDVAEDICDARANGCCTGVDPASCVDGELRRCVAQRDALAAESSLTFEARTAESRRRAARMVLDLCGAPPVLASFFTGGFADGTACERDTQCSNGLCTLDTRVCALAPTALCPTP